jgi:hypothetical protein
MGKQQSEMVAKFEDQYGAAYRLLVIRELAECAFFLAQASIIASVNKLQIHRFVASFWLSIIIETPPSSNTEMS